MDKPMKAKTQSKPVPSQIVDKDEKRKAIEGAIGQIEKDFGKGTIMRMGEAPELEVSAISTGSLRYRRSPTFRDTVRMSVMLFYRPTGMFTRTLR